MFPEYYESIFSSVDRSAKFFPKFPFINSDIITGSHIKLYIPFHRLMETTITGFCENVDLQKKYFNSSDDEKTQAYKEDEMLNCINKAYLISIDDQSIEVDFVFNKYLLDKFSLNTLYTYIPIDSMENGKHVLRIEKKIADDLERVAIENGEFNITYSMDNDSIINIPFYISK